MQSSAQTVEEYIDSLPPERREGVQKLRETVVEHLPKGYEEGMDYGMISYYIPLATYPDTYNKHPLSYIAIASQKNYLSIYMLGMYGQPENEAWLREAFAKAGKKLDMGKSCIRFKKIEDIPFEVIARAVQLMTPDEYIALYEKHRSV